MQTSQASRQLFLEEIKAQMQPLLLTALWEQIFVHRWLANPLMEKKIGLLKGFREILSEAD